jgi:hypothetical protein
MDRIETILTKVRPVKKLFILEPGDRTTFVRCLRLCSEEILGIRNLFLINNESLLSENNVALVRAHDPDVVVNYSSRDNKELYQDFKTLVKSGTPTSLNANGFSTKLMSFQTSPAIYQGLTDLGIAARSEETVFTVVLSEDSDPTDIQLLFSLHCGLIDNEELEHLDWTIFRSISIKTIDTLEDFWRVINHCGSNFLNLCLPYFRFTDHHSIWEVDQNPQQYFRNKPSVIIADSFDLDSIAYFWNARASYPESQILWMPDKMLEADKERLADYEQYCLFVGDPKDFEMKLGLEGKVRIDTSRHYFPNRDDWQTFNFLQQGTVVKNVLSINHPKERLFSSMGLNLAFMLEIRGPEDFLIPNSSVIGELFIKSPQLTSIEHFTRISSRGLSTAQFDLEFPSDQSVFARMNLPETKDVFKALFSEYGLTLAETDKSLLTAKIINLVGGSADLKLFRNQRIFELIVTLAAPRVERIVKKLLQGIGPELELATEGIYEILERNIGGLTTINTRPIVDADQLLSRASEQRTNRTSFYSRIQELYDKRILLRGKRFNCTSCEKELWFPLEAIRDDLKCYCCGERTRLPVHSNGEILGDAFRLNELIAEAVDQGVLPVLLTVLFLSNQRFLGKRFMYDVDILSESVRLAEADLVFTFGKRLGLAEVKADRGFDLNQVDKLIAASDRLRADTLVFSTLKSSESDEVRSLSEYLSRKNLRIPALLLGKEALFADEPPDISKYFELVRGENRFPIGQIILDARTGLGN